MPVNSPIGCDAWSVGVALYCWAASVWSRSDFAARYCRFGDNTPDDRLNSWTWGSHPSPLVYNSAPPAKVTGKAASRIFKNGFQKWYVYRRLFRKFEGIAFSVWKEKGFTRNFPPPFDTYTSGDLWTECECRKKKTETAETHNERKKQRTFYCFMWALLRYALNHAPAQRDLEKLKNALEALQTGEPNLGVLVEAAPSGKSASSFAQTNSRPSSEDITTTTTEAEPNGELQQLIHASTDQSQTFNSNADAVIRDEEASSSTLVSEEPEGPSSASARAHYKVVHPHVQKGKYYKKMNKKNKAGEDFNAFLELQGFVRNNFDEKDAEKDEPLIDVPVTKQEEDRDRDQPSASVQGPETSGGLGSGILEL
ncbi:unnamed protein product [Amoebophrya sp. A25]|nr:unnamed protein product [Amoebophrya sp. A25]|eukprot:GSA25T00021098001.1